MSLPQIKDLNVYYGAIHALKNLSLTVNPGEIVTLIGANGAGKSTTLRTISGLIRPRNGTVTFEQHDLTRLPPERIVMHGVCQSPEGRRVFPQMSVRENL